MTYEHSFGLGGNFAIIAEHPMWTDMKKMVTVHTLMGALTYDVHGNTTFHVVDLTDKTVTKFVAPAYLIYHFANIFVDENGDIDMTMPVAFGCNVYELFHMPTLLNATVLNHFRDNCGELKVRLFTLHRSGALAGTVTTKAIDDGFFEFPQWNQHWRGRRTCFLYVVEWFHNSTQGASMAVVKLDTCKEKRAATYAIRGHFPGEAKFVARPGGTEEDDGVLICPILDGAKQASYLAILDAKTMQPLERFDLASVCH